LQNVEKCPGCGEEIVDSEKIIVAGKEWHKTCHQVSLKPGREFGKRTNQIL
jgi:predicted nucleic-acid-binding Zn-ribbon protein